MAFAAPFPFASQRMVTVAFGQWLIKHQRVQNWLQIGVERRPVLSFAFTLEVALE